MALVPRSEQPSLEIGTMKINARASCSNIEILESRIAPATLVVMNLNDTGTGSLRAAIATADLTSGDRIEFHHGLQGTISLDSGELLITSRMSIVGPGAADITVATGGHAHGRVFDINAPSKTVDAPVSISGLTITNGGTLISSNPGGGIYSTESLTLTHVVISGCQTGGKGGGVYILPDTSNAKVTITDSTISDNIATGDGGGLFIKMPAPTAGAAGAKVSISNSVITGNTSGNTGGGIFEDGAASMTVAGTKVSNNSANLTTGGGGGVYAEVSTTSSRLFISRSNFTGNQAGYAGGLQLDDVNTAATSKVTISGTLITSNNALNSDGGGLDFGSGTTSGGHVLISGSTISGNTAALSGGGIYSDDFAALTVRGSTIEENKANGNLGGGGGMSLDGASPVVIATTKILDNTTAGDGGGIGAGGGLVLTMTSCTVTGNSATVGAGLNQLGAVHLKVTGGEFSDNTAVDSGGAMSLGGGINNSGSITITGTKVIGNSASDIGGGIFANITGSVTLKDDTVSTNMVIAGGISAQGGGLGITDATDVLISRCAIHDNTAATSGGGVYFYDSTGSILHSSITGNVANTKAGGVYIAGTGSNVTVLPAEVAGNTAPIDPNILG
jgi:predicted outer membrane repeat protein